MADELFLQAFTHANVRRFERRLGLLTSDVRKSCGSRFLSNLESAIFSRAVTSNREDERLRNDEVLGLSFPRRRSARG